MSGNDIPTRSREILRVRDRGLCVRCTGPGRAVHHRRSRRVRDEHRHCPCNLVTLCNTCHAWAHAHPDLAMAQGMVASQWVEQPQTVRLKAWWGWVETDCQGGAEWRKDP